MADIKSQTLRDDCAAPALPDRAARANHGSDEHPKRAQEDHIQFARTDAIVNHELEQARHAQLHGDRQDRRPEAEE